MHRAVLVCVYGQLRTDVLAVTDDGWFSSGARHDRLRVGIVDHVGNLSNVAALHRSRSLLLGIAPYVIDLDEAGMGCSLPAKECLHLAVMAGVVEALVALNVAE
jgi:hypothetical protein